MPRQQTSTIYPLLFMTEETAAEKELADIKFSNTIFKEADKRYAIKVTERILFGMLVLFGVAIVMKIAITIGLPAPSL